MSEILAFTANGAVIKLEMTDRGLVDVDGVQYFRSEFNFDGKNHIVDVDKRLIDRHGVGVRRREENLAMLKQFGLALWRSTP